MSTDLAQQPTRQAIAAQNRSLPNKVTGKLRAAIEAMVWKASSRKEAAEQAGMADHSLREALRRPHVMGFYLGQCEVLRLSGRAKRLHRLEEIAAMDRNLNASVAAIKAAELLADEPAHGGRGGNVTMPGLVIQIVHAVPRSPAPLIDLQPETAPDAATAPIFRP